uniref:sulfatase family protein n=1 Tax=Ningiella ruwaisensis TaxID=2364274 RepID=UPI00109FCF37|nr:sulfatase [Ningiella ruwaisensis]
MPSAFASPGRIVENAQSKCLFIIAAFTLLLACSDNAKTQLQNEADNSPQLPNIVLVLTDDQGYADASAFGQEAYSTPNIDSLADNGLMLTQFYVAQPVCSASRAAILTGAYPNRIGVSSAFMPSDLVEGPPVGLNLDEETLPELLKLKGYNTALFGKWHLGDTAPFLPTYHGFDEFYGIPYSNDMWSANVNKKFAFADLPIYQQDKVVKVLTDDQSNLTTELTEKSVDFINRNADSPFFLMLSHPQPHVPLFVSDKFKGKSGAGLYGDVMMEIDWSTGELIKALKQNNILKNTLFIYMSDNGPWLSFGEHAGSAGILRNGKLSSFEGGIRTPALVQWPGTLPQNQRIDTPMISMDWLPTIINLIDGKLPDKKIDGHNIWPILSGQTQDPTREAFFFYFHKNDLTAVRFGDWKLYYPHRYNLVIEPGENGKRGEEEWPMLSGIELYNLKDDPSETKNVVEDHPEVVAQIEALANEKRQALGDNLQGIEGSERRPVGRLGE